MPRGRPAKSAALTSAAASTSQEPAAKKAATTKDEPAKASRGRGRPAGQKRKYKKKQVQTFSRYIHKVLHQVHPDTTISKTAMSIMNSFGEFHLPTNNKNCFSFSHFGSHSY